MFDRVGDVGAPIDKHRSLAPFGAQNKIRHSALISSSPRPALGSSHEHVKVLRLDRRKKVLEIELQEKATAHVWLGIVKDRPVTPIGCSRRMNLKLAENMP